MPISPSERQLILSQVNTLAVQDLNTLWRRAEQLSNTEFAQFVIDAFPSVVDPFAAIAGDLAADWYEESAPELEYVASPSGMPDESVLAKSASWALGATGEAGLDRLAGTLQRAVFNAARETILDNVRRERGAGWARHASANACAFCRMLATRGAVYSSRGSAMKSHDFCHCVAIEVRPGTSYEPAPYVERWTKEYNRARRDAGSGDPKQILAAWRQVTTAS